MNRLVWQRTCPECGGRKVVQVATKGQYVDSHFPCPNCNGTGTITEPADDVVDLARGLVTPLNGHQQFCIMCQSAIEPPVFDHDDDCPTQAVLRKLEEER